MKVLQIDASVISNSDLRIDAAYHLSDGPETLRKFESSPYKISTLEEETTEIFSGNIFKRTYVSNDQHGHQFLTASDMMKTNPRGTKFISKKYTKDVNRLRILKGSILVSRSGTLGNTIFTNGIFEDLVGTDDLIRIIPNEANTLRGYLYAFLASKYGYALLTQASYGGVVKHIEPHHLTDLPVPIFPKELQERIHNLITEAARLREDADRLLREAISIFDQNVGELEGKPVYLSDRSQFEKRRLRFDAHANLSAFEEYYQELAAKYDLAEVAEKSGDVFTPGIFKRMRVDNPLFGVPFLSGTNLLEVFPNVDSFLSKKMPNIDNYVLRKGWIAIQDSGSPVTMGNCSIVPEYFDGFAATNNLVRIIPKKGSDFNYYLFPFLQSKAGQVILKSFSYGTGQRHLDTYQIKSLRVPLLSDSYDEIVSKSRLYLESQERAFSCEKQARNLVEKEIESWQ